jgi:uncharacterized protein YggE
MEVLRIRGNGCAKIEPNIIVIDLKIEKTFKLYSDVIEAFCGDTNRLIESLLCAGIERKQIKTIDFGIIGDYRSFKDEFGERKNVLNGYRYNHDLEIKIEKDNVLLSKILNVLEKSEIHAYIGVKFSFDNLELLENAALENAIHNAKNKAELIAKSMKVKLGSVTDINYKTINSRLSGDHYRCETITDYCGLENVDIDVDDLIVEDDIEIIWKIEEDDTKC